jgi:hypothetical protein
MSRRKAKPGRHSDASLRLLAPRLVVLFGIGCLIFATPALWPARAQARVGGVPLLYVVLFGAWAAFIAGVGWLVESAARRPPQEPGSTATEPADDGEDHP